MGGNVGFRAGLVAACVLATTPLAAQTFEEAIAAARRTDAQYAAALAIASTRRVQSAESATAYYPSANIAYQPATVGSNRFTRSVTLTQPLLSADRYLVLKQVEPFATQAEAEAHIADSDLNLRVFRTMADIVRFSEALRANGVQVDGLKEQLQRSRRMHQLGQGTITEISDFEVRVAIAQANAIAQRNALEAAQRTFKLLTGLQPNASSINVEDAAKAGIPPDEAGFVARVREHAAPVKAAREAVRLQEIAALRVRAEYLPQLNATATHSKTSGTGAVKDLRIGLALNVTLGSATIFSDRRAAIELARTQDVLRYQQDLFASEALRLLRAAEAYSSEVAIRERAVAAAKLALEGNLKSYQGGVKTNIDVVTSYQNVADTEFALVNARLSRTETLLSLSLLLPDRDPPALPEPVVRPLIPVGKSVDLPRGLPDSDSSAAAQPAAPVERNAPPAGPILDAPTGFGSVEHFALTRPAASQPNHVNSPRADE